MKGTSEYLNFCFFPMDKTERVSCFCLKTVWSFQKGTSRWAEALERHHEEQ